MKKIENFESTKLILSDQSNLLRNLLRNSLRKLFQYKIKQIIYLRLIIIDQICGKKTQK